MLYADKKDTDQPAGMRTLVSDCIARCLESLIPTDAAYIHVHVHVFAIVQLGHAHAQKRLFSVNAKNTVFSDEPLTAYMYMLHATYM